MRGFVSLLVSLFALFTPFSPCWAQSVWTVHGEGEADFHTIRACIEDPAVQDGDTCLVQEGIYAENITFSGKAVTVRSVSGPEGTVIDGGAAGSVVTFASGEGSDSVLEGFTIRNGSGTWAGYMFAGGGVFVSGSSPTIRDCRISENVVSGRSQFAFGGGVACLQASPAITRCTIANNHATGDPGDGTLGTGGGGIFLLGESRPVISHCLIHGNTCTHGGETMGGGIASVDASPAVTNCVISGNLVSGEGVFVGGGGIFLSGGAPAITNSTLAGNEASGNGTYIIGGGLLLGVDAFPAITNSILWGDQAPHGPEVFLIENASPVITYSDVQMENPGEVWPGEGNRNDAPLFRSPDDTHLLDGSPCIDAGDPSGGGLPPQDIDGQARLADGDCDQAARVDMGADEFQVPCPWPPASTLLSAGGRQAGDPLRSGPVNSLAMFALPLAWLGLSAWRRRRHRLP